VGAPRSTSARTFRKFGGQAVIVSGHRYTARRITDHRPWPGRRPQPEAPLAAALKERGSLGGLVWRVPGMLGNSGPSRTLGRRRARRGPDGAFCQPDCPGATGIARPPTTAGFGGNVAFTGSFNPTFSIPSSSTWTFQSGGGTLAQTGADISSSNQVTSTHLASGLPRNQGGLNSTYRSQSMC
jgi:hypothetical protein